MSAIVTWVASHSGWCYAFGWGLVISALGLELSALSRPSDEISRYPPDAIALQLGLLVMALTAVGATIWMALQRRLRKLAGVVLHGMIVLPAIWSGLLFHDPFSNHVCGEDAGCFFLKIAPIPTDTIYEIWSAPTRYSPTLTRLETGNEFNYSEDGSYTSKAHLILSDNEEIVVLARGGHFVDAIEIATGDVLSTFVGWGEADIAAKMTANSEQIRLLLEQNR